VGFRLAGMVTRGCDIEGSVESEGSAGLTNCTAQLVQTVAVERHEVSKERFQADEVVRGGGCDGLAPGSSLGSGYKSCRSSNPHLESHEHP